jgi:NADH:ubiquinone oxidoreductase subunit E
MMTITPLISEFTAIGQLQELTIKSDGRVKYLRLSTEQQEYWLKVAKDQPKSLSQLQPGCRLEVKGMVKQKLKQDTVEYKAYSIKLLNVPSLTATSVNPSTTKPGKSKQLKAKVLICKKSNCWNQGGKEICRKLESELDNRGISEQVEIKTTGCLNKCKKAPNLVILPDKKQYVRVRPQQIATIIESHFS